MIVETEREDNDLFRSLHQNPFRDNISIHNLVAPTEDKAEDLNRLRTTLRNSIFKARPSTHLKQGINWELVYARVNISCVNVTLSCAIDHHRIVRGDSMLPVAPIRNATPAPTPNRVSTPAANLTRSISTTPSSQPQESQLPSSSASSGLATPVKTATEKDKEKRERTESQGSSLEIPVEMVTVQCKFTGINIKAKHRTMDTKLSLVVRDLDIIDVVLSKMKG